MPAPAPAPAPEPPRPSGNVWIRCTPDDAEVVVDGVSRGLARDYSGTQRLALAPGKHRVELRRAGYRAFRTEIAVGVRIEDIEVRLQKAPEGQ